MLQTRTITINELPVVQGLIKWQNLLEEDATRRIKALFKANFPLSPLLGDKKVLLREVLLHIREERRGLQLRIANCLAKSY